MSSSSKMTYLYSKHILEKLWRSGTVVVTLLFVSVQTMAADVAIGVLYPKVRAPYNQVFVSLTQGIERAESVRVHNLELDKGSSIDLGGWVEKHQPKGIIALGSRSVNKVKQAQLSSSLPVVVGGTFFGPSITESGMSGISMAPNPEYLFDHLLQLLPKVKTVHVVYHPAREGWLIELAKVAAKRRGMSLHAIAAEDVREHAIAYREILSDQKKHVDALWLPYSGRSLDKVLMNMVLESAWKKDLAVFSSNMADVSKGVLFSLYSDNEAMGQRLQSLLVEHHLQEKKSATFMLSDALFSAINTRTAVHLGIHISKEEQQKYQLRFPLER